MTLNDVLQKLQLYKWTDDNETDIFIDQLSDDVQDLKADSEQKQKLIDCLLLFIESANNVECISWSLIHYMEWLSSNDPKNYYHSVVLSLERNPKYITLVLINRILNGINLDQLYREKFIRNLKETGLNLEVNSFIRGQANEFYQFQMTK